MDFDRAEKLAVVKALAETIDLDERYKVGELVYLDQLMNTLDFDARFVEESKRLDSEEAVTTLKGMSDEKKKALIIMINEMIEADGTVHKRETNFLVNLLSTLG